MASPFPCLSSCLAARRPITHFRVARGMTARRALRRRRSSGRLRLRARRWLNLADLLRTARASPHIPLSSDFKARGRADPHDAKTQLLQLHFCELLRLASLRCHRPSLHGPGAQWRFWNHPLNFTSK
ncbi:hypothetical protein AAFF_G00030270 [Aldrovandia affinis]|uniref:Uncharacterized protein n=1 Tax=Aldrovandia affinis TaxID=143900 RepID=A0AAD7WFU0_9TELE|nr:hypothetical protein AAFF_G00030270 [Aldrovandia affinis]